MKKMSRRGPPEGAIFIDGEVPFHDIDPLHIAWHGHYFKYLELARTALFRKHGIDGEELLETGYRFVVVDAHCRYVSPLLYGHRYRVWAWFLDVEQRIHVAYEIKNLSEDRRAARGRTVLVTTDHEGRMLMETPDVLLSRIRS